MRLKLLNNIAPYLLITGVAFFMFRGIFAPGFMSGYDNSFHYYDAYYLTKTLIPKYHWIGGWSMQSLAGCPILVDYYQIGFLALAFLNKILCLSLNLSYKIMVFASYVILGSGFYKLASSRFGKEASLIVSICLMLQKDVYYDRILGGIWNNYLAIGLIFIFFHILDKEIENLGMRKAVILGFTLGMIILTHLYVAVFGFLLLFVYLFPYIRIAARKKRLLKNILVYLIIPAAAFTISAYYLYGFVIARNYFLEMPWKDMLTGLIWSLKSFFSPLEKAIDPVSTFMINAPVILRIIFGFFGLYMFLKKERDAHILRFLTIVIVLSISSLILFSDILPNVFNFWRRIPFLRALQTTRFLIYAQAGGYLFAAYGIARFLGRINRKRPITALFFALVLLSAFFHYQCFAKDGSRTLEQSARMPNVLKVWGWVKDNIPPEKSRIVYQNTVGAMDDNIMNRSDLFALSGVFTKVPQIGVGRSASPFPQEKYLRMDHGMVFGKPILGADASYISEMMNCFNSSYILSVEPALKNVLSDSELFIKEKEYGPFSIFRLNNPKGGWIRFEKEAYYNTVTFEDQCLVFDIRNASSGNEAFINIAYHPFWLGRLNGKPVKIEHDRYSLMKVALPDEGNYRLELSFNCFNPIWAGISLAGFLISLAVIFAGGIKKNRVKNA